MFEKETVDQPPNVGTCCVRGGPEKGIVGTREYIYNLLAQPVSQVNPQKRLPRIRIKAPPLPDEVTREPCKTMGPPVHPHPEKIECPQKFKFKRKHWRTPFMERKCVEQQVRLATEAFEKLKMECPNGRIKGGCCAGTKPPVPTTGGLRYELDADGVPLRCKKMHNTGRTNWIERNAIQAITCKPGGRMAHPGHRYQVDTRNGDSQALDSNKTHSGLEKRYVYKPAYGKVPRYIKVRAEAIRETRDLFSHYLNEKAMQCTDHMLTEKERQDLLTGLKLAWDRYNAKYLGLSASSTTLKNKTYKQYLEKQLSGLERDIQLIESHPYIFIDANKKPGVGNIVTSGLEA